MCKEVRGNAPFEWGYALHRTLRSYQMPRLRTPAAPQPAARRGSSQTAPAQNDKGRKTPMPRHSASWGAASSPPRTNAPSSSMPTFRAERVVRVLGVAIMEHNT